jgi:nitroreductase
MSANTPTLAPDELLTTTRSVRKRLDFDRPVERELVMECLEIALQAPTGSNRQGWQWVVVTEPDTRKAIAEHYGRNFDVYMNMGSREYPEGDARRDRQAAVRESAQFLRVHMHEAPALVIPLQEGRIDGADAFGQASYWGSLLPGAWSFMLALRSRGLGSAWTTLHLPNEKDVAELLGIPYERYTQAGLFPVAYTIGTDFKPAVRKPIEALTYWDSWGSTDLQTPPRN